MLFEFASGQIQGRRSAQEDTVDILVPGPAGAGASGGELARAGIAASLVTVVADGMGGHVGGRIASNLVSKSFLEAVAQPVGEWGARLDAALERANGVLREAAETRPELGGMGSTLVGAVMTDAGLGWVSIGDSGLHLFRDGRLERLNEDHSFGAYLDEQAARGLIDRKAAASDRRRNQLFHALLGQPLDHFEEFDGFHPLAPGDVVLLASDGLKTLDDSTIGAVVEAHRDEPPERIVAALLDAVEAAGRERQDNTSVILVRVVERDLPPDRARLDRPTTVPLGDYAGTIAVPLDAERTGDTALLGRRPRVMEVEALEPAEVPVASEARLHPSGGAEPPRAPLHQPDAARTLWTRFAIACGLVAVVAAVLFWTRALK
ncbi:PP2C family protein-serine/threonine phosphatase [Methyloraptor flagellatus]|uniref:Protein phosphatase 2C domain-containing protein n=1 Tax=Methyloraptor flagellatus TaxID=3162530 RepID=A0AAU7XF19_9HYPH